VALKRADPLSKESCRMSIGLRNWNNGQCPIKGFRASSNNKKLSFLFILAINGLMHKGT
jgi:hypothetical protein